MNIPILTYIKEIAPRPIGLGEAQSEALARAGADVLMLDIKGGREGGCAGEQPAGG